jgi:hypothetical protein
MKTILLATTFVAMTLAAPAVAQRSLFDQPVQNAPSPAPAPTAPPAAAPAPSAPAAQPAAPAQAEEPSAAPRRAKPRKPRGPVPARALSIVNGSPSALVGLEVSQDGRSATLRRPIPAGKKGRLALPAFKACEVNVTATFEGVPPGAAAPVDICKEKVLNFRD